MKPYPWQQTAWQRLCQQWTNQRLPHALLLSGIAGLGKLSFAEIFAQLLLCSASKNQVACGECHACHLFVNKSHPDFYLIQPELASKVIKIEQIREVCSDITQTARQKIVIIEPAEALHGAAANAMLKTLEEPSGNTLIMLISHFASQIPITLRSRCQTIAFYPTPDISEQWLQTKIAGDLPQALLLRLSGGSPLHALRWAPLVAQYFALGNDLVSLQDPQAVTQRWLEETEIPLWQWLSLWISDFIRMKYQRAMPYLSSASADIPRVVSKLKLRSLFHFYDKLTQAQQKLAGNINKQILLEDIFYAWYQVLAQGK
jgi:DNA polymerase-3 subunit delta'